MGISARGSLRSRRWRHRRVRLPERVRARIGASRTSTATSSRYPTRSKAPGIRTGRMRLGRTRTVGNAPNGASRIIAGNVGSFWTGRNRTGSTRSDTTGPKFPRLKSYGARIRAPFGYDRFPYRARRYGNALQVDKSAKSLERGDVFKIFIFDRFFRRKIAEIVEISESIKIPSFWSESQNFKRGARDRTYQTVRSIPSSPFLRQNFR